jgi:hypothetical protein
MGFMTDPNHWRKRAESMRRTAHVLQDEAAKARMLKIAQGYDLLTRRMEEQSRLWPDKETVCWSIA